MMIKKINTMESMESNDKYGKKFLKLHVLPLMIKMEN